MSGNLFIEMDVSNIDIGSVLSQDQGKGLQYIAYFSRKLAGALCNYTTHEWELLAIVIAVKE